jgi:ribosomal peptide maturation radical SAM protein 1
MSDVLFVSMPFGPVFTPSIGLSLLQAQLHRAGVPSDVRYFSIRFAERLGSRMYSAISQSDGVPIVNLAGEWIFSRELNPAADGSGYIEEVIGPRSPWGVRHRGSRRWRDTRDRIVRARALVAPYLDWCVDQVAAASPRIVGLTSSFQQHAASLVLAKRLRAALPDVRIVIGGANCEGVMGAETIRQFPFVDAAVSGEADTIIVDLVTRLLDGRSIEDVPGVRTQATVGRDFAAGRFGIAPMVTDMDALPYPDYSAYARQFRASPLSRRWRPSMLFESSRGCWWGEKAHCTFCGLNGSTMTYRSKPTDRVLAELRHLATRYPRSDVQVVDNILEMRYFGDLLPELARNRLKIELFYETKANLKKDQIRLLRDAGVTRIQPGIETFSDAVLALMRKGVTWLQNVQLLKWCKQFGVSPYWNVLWGFPREPAAEYERMARLVPALTHLPAPVGGAAIRLDRFSPNFDQADRLGFARIRPIAPYAHIFTGVPGDAIGNLAYYFQFDHADGRDIQDYVLPLKQQIARWKRVHRRSELVSIRQRDRRVIVDLRPGATTKATVLAGADRALYEACDGIAHVHRLAALAGADADGGDGAVIARLQPLIDQGLLVTDGQRYLALAIPLEEYRPPAAMRARIRQVLRRLVVVRQSVRAAKEQESWPRRSPRRKRQQRRRPRSGSPRGGGRRSA